MSKTRINSELYKRNLLELSQTIVKEKNRLVKPCPDPAADYLFRLDQGIPLSSDGVEDSIFGLQYIINHSSLKSFNKYPGSSNAYSSLTQDICKQFLKEEGLIAECQDQSTLNVAYSFASHEALTRLARTLFKPNVNEGAFVASSSYSSIAIALRELKPLGYNVFFIDVAHDGKISISHLEKLIRENPLAKILFLELKTTAGVVYTETELREIILFCQKHQLFLIASAVHLHMEFESQYKFPIVSSLCNELNYHEYAVLFSGSKTYGLERARVGLVLFDTRNQSFALGAMDSQFIRMFGTFSDLPIVATYCLLTYPLEARQKYLKANVEKHRFNLSLMLAYIEGIDSNKIDEELRTVIKAEIPQECQNGISGLRVICKPQCGIHLKVDLSQFIMKYFLNIQMFNSEILSYVFNKMFGVTTHNLFQINPLSYEIQLSFSSKQNVHTGMRLMHDFLSSLTDKPQSNPFMKIVITKEWLMNQSEVKFADTKRYRRFADFGRDSVETREDEAKSPGLKIYSRL